MLRIQFVTLPRLKLPFLLQPQSVILGRKKKIRAYGSSDYCCAVQVSVITKTCYV